MRSVSSIIGNSQKLDGGAMFGNAPKALWERWLPCDESNRVPLACRALLVREDHRNILFETGVGASFEPALKERYGVNESQHVLLASLREHGLQPNDIDIIVLSHLHFDHAGGMLSPYVAGQAPTLVFKRAKVIVGAAAWERARKPHPRDRASFLPHLHALLDASGQLHVVEGEMSDLLGDGFRFFVSDGHTPGMLVTQISMPDGPIVFAADLIPGTPWVHVPITMGYDRYPERLIDEKQQLLEWVVDSGARILYTHDPIVATSRVTIDGKGRFAATQTLTNLAGITR